MSRFRVYLKVFKDDGTYEDDFREITRDVSNLGSLSQQLDNTEYGVGVFRNGGVTIKLRNDEGLYGEADSLKSIFRYKKQDCIVKITWDFRDYDLICGWFNAGEEMLVDEVTIFEGLLTEVSSASNIKMQDINFQVLGYETLFDREIVPFADVNDGDLVSDVLFKILDQLKITSLLTVDVSNISVGIDTAIDLKESLENQTVKEALTNLLFISNSVLRIENKVVKISNRNATPDVKMQFYGQGSNRGIENIIDIKKHRDGLNRTFNFWTWEDSTQFARDPDSVEKYGVLKHTIQSDLIQLTSNVKIENILESNRDEFAFPKAEFELDTPIKYETLALNLLDRVSVDYPTIYTAADGNPLPRYGFNNYENAVYPYEQWSLNISANDRYKITSKKIDTTKSIITFGMRRI